MKRLLLALGVLIFATTQTFAVPGDVSFPLYTTGAPNVTTLGTITTADTNQICTSTNWGNQNACVGTPTKGSAFQVPIASAGYLWAQAVTVTGTLTSVNFVIRISNDGGTTWFNRGIFAVTNVAPFQINNIVTPNFAGWLTGGVTNVEVIATTYAGTGSPSTIITITQGQATPFSTSSAISTSLSGVGSTAATNVQGNGPTSLPLTLPNIAGSAVVNGVTSAPMTGTAAVNLIAAVGGQHIYVTSIHCNNSGTVSTLVDITSGAAGTLLDVLSVPATFGSDERNGGAAPMFETAAGVALTATNVTTGASVNCQAAGFSSAN
jgi:hypothetical protein